MRKAGKANYAFLCDTVGKAIQGVNYSRIIG